jgi:TetR/AcrR family fatty acid metabolism transcriptional regulator
MTPKIVDKEAKKIEIIHAAVKVFSEKGMVKAKMVDIASEAGIGKGTIYEYFRSKEEIFTSGFQMFFEGMQNTIETGLKSTDDPVEQLKLLINLSLTSFFQHGSDLAMIMMDFWAEGIRNKDEKILNAIDLRQIYHEFRIIIQSILNNGIKQGIFRKVDTHHTASLWIGALDGLMLQWIMDHKVIDIKKITDSVIDNLLNGLYKK